MSTEHATFIADGVGWTAPAKRTLRISATALMVLSLAPMPASAATSYPDESCPVVAAASGVQVMVSASDNLFLQAPTGAATPVAQACVDYGLADSSGFASNPYPGDTVISAPAIIRGAAGQPVPDYPAYAASRYPSAEQSKVERRGYSLSARSSGTRSDARARAGADQGGSEAGAALATATAAVDPARNTSTASATSDIQPVTIKGALELGRVRSTATARIGPDGQLTRQSSLTVGHTEIGDQVVEITPDGVTAAGQTAPVPKADPVDQLETAGLRVRYLAAEKSARGQLSAGIEVLARHQDPETGAVYTAAYTFGRSFAAVAPVEVPDSSGGPPPPPAAPPVGDGATSSSGDAPVASGSGSGDAVASGPAPAAAPDVPAADAGAAPDPVVAAPTGLIGSPADMGLEGSYLVLGFGALAMFVSGMVLRVLGVRTRWTA